MHEYKNQCGAFLVPRSPCVKPQTGGRLRLRPSQRKWNPQPGASKDQASSLSEGASSSAPLTLPPGQPFILPFLPGCDTYVALVEFGEPRLPMIVENEDRFDHGEEEEEAAAAAWEKAVVGAALLLPPRPPGRPATRSQLKAPPATPARRRLVATEELLLVHVTTTRNRNHLTCVKLRWEDGSSRRTKHTHTQERVP